MAVCGIEHYRVDSFCGESGHAVKRVPGDADSRGHAQPAASILAGVGMQAFLEYVLVGDQADYMPLAVDDGQLLDLVFLQHLAHIFPVRLRVRYRDEVLGGHYVPDEHGHVVLETHVAVGHYSDEMPFAVGHRNAADVVVVHEPERVADRLVLVDGHRVVDHAVFGALHLAHLCGLGLYAHVLMNNADSTFSRKSYGHRRFGHGVHRGGHDRDVEGDVPRKAAAQVYFSRQDFRV